MRFSKPINREVDIDGNTFIVSLDENGVEFRVKGKRKTARVAWVRVLDIAEGDQGVSARQFLGVTGGSPASSQGTAAPDRAHGISETGLPQSAFAPQETGDASAGAEESASEQSDEQSNEELRRSVTASDTRSEY